MGTDDYRQVLRRRVRRKGAQRRGKKVEPELDWSRALRCDHLKSSRDPAAKRNRAACAPRCIVRSRLSSVHCERLSLVWVIHVASGRPRLWRHVRSCSDCGHNGAWQQNVCLVPQADSCAAAAPAICFWRRPCGRKATSGPAGMMRPASVGGLFLRRSMARSCQRF